MAVFFFAALMGVVVLWGARSADQLNRCFVAGLVISFLAIVLLLMSHAVPERLVFTEPKHAWLAMPVLLTAFGYQIVIPSLRHYLNSRVNQLNKAIFYGSFIALLAYAFWEMLIIGALPLKGPFGLLTSVKSTSTLILALENTVGHSWPHWFIYTFLFFLVITSLIGVSLSLFDFLTDGLPRIKKRSLKKGLALGLTFLPPLLMLAVFPHGFIGLLNYAGAFVAALLVFLPAWMAWAGRYHKNLRGPYRAPIGKLGLLGLMAFSVLIVVIEFVL